MLITNVTDVEQPIDAVPSVDTLEELTDPLHKLYELALTGDIELAAETYYRAGQYVATVTELYTDGKLSLAEKAFAEQCYAALCRRLHRALTAAQRSHRQVYDELHDKLADKVFLQFLGVPVAAGHLGHWPAAAHRAFAPAGRAAAAPRRAARPDLRFRTAK